LPDYGYRECDTMLRIGVFFILFGNEHADLAVNIACRFAGLRLVPVVRLQRPGLCLRIWRCN